MRSMLRQVAGLAVAGLAILSTATCAGAAETATLRRQIGDAGLTPWNGGTISLDSALRDPNGDKVTLRRLVGKPIVAYNYAQW